MTSSRLLPVRLSPRPVRTLGRRLARSGVARDLYADRYFIATLALLAVCGLLVLLLTRGEVFTWDGVHSVPAKLPAHLDGTDAGLLPPDAGYRP